jgi:cobalt/nickel transport system ATP-binding protein
MAGRAGIIIEAENLSIRYPDGTAAVEGVSFAVPSGENAALIGANGAGKTSILLALVGILPLSSGSICVGGTELSGARPPEKTLRELRRRVGLVFQNPEDQLFMPSIFEDLAFGPRNMGLPEDEVIRRVDAALNRLDIAYLRGRSPLKLSGGERRLSSLAAVLTMEPEVMLFDEPSAFLDPRARRGLINILKSLPHTKLIATHDLDLAAEVCGKAILLRNGKILAQGRAETLLHDPEYIDRVFFQEERR